MSLSSSTDVWLVSFYLTSNLAHSTVAYNAADPTYITYGSWSIFKSGCSLKFFLAFGVLSGKTLTSGWNIIQVKNITFFAQQSCIIRCGGVDYAGFITTDGYVRCVSNLPAGSYTIDTNFII